MILTLNMYDLDKTNIIIGTKDINLIDNYNFYYKIFYSTSNYVMNGIYIKLNLINYKQNNYYNYIKINYNVQNNIKLITLIGELEQYILSNVIRVGGIKPNLYNELMRHLLLALITHYLPLRDDKYNRRTKFLFLIFL